MIKFWKLAALALFICTSAYSESPKFNRSHFELTGKVKTTSSTTFSPKDVFGELQKGEPTIVTTLEFSDDGSLIFKKTVQNGVVTEEIKVTNIGKIKITTRKKFAKDNEGRSVLQGWRFIELLDEGNNPLICSNFVYSKGEDVDKPFPPKKAKKGIVLQLLGARDNSDDEMGRVEITVDEIKYLPGTGLKNSVTTRNSGGDIVNKSILKYSDGTNISEIITYGPSGDMVQKRTYVYENGKEIQGEVFDQNESIVQRSQTKRDGHGNPIEMTAAWGPQLGFKVTSKMKYDAKNRKVFETLSQQTPYNSFGQTTKYKEVLDSELNPTSVTQQVWAELNMKVFDGNADFNGKATTTLTESTYTYY